MLDPVRIRSRMEVLNVSQANLAKRVGVSQQTIGRLVTGGTFGSRYLHLIARELQTTPEYLTGETDDPHGEVGPAADLTMEERDWVELLRSIAPKDRAAALQLVRTIAHSAQSPMVQAHAQDFRPKDKGDRL